jgi:AAA+ superfamily predicted ATPase
MFYMNSLQHLQAEMGYVDALIKCYLQKQPVSQNSLSVLQWEEIASWLFTATDDAVMLRERIDTAAAASRQQGFTLRLADLQDRLSLTKLERKILLLCLAPALDSRYQKLYAYAQEDIQGHQPRLNFIIRVLADTLEEQWILQNIASHSSTLVSYGLINPGSQELHSTVSIPKRLVEYLLGSEELDGRLAAMVQRREPTKTLAALDVAMPLRMRLQELSERYLATPYTLHLYVTAAIGMGKMNLAEALAHALNLPLLSIDITAVLEQTHLSFAELIHLLQLELTLQPAVCYWRQADNLLASEHKAKLRALQRYLAEQTLPNVLGARQEWQPQDWPNAIPLTLHKPDFAARHALWQQLTAKVGLSIAAATLKNLAQRFQLAPGQIQSAIQVSGQLQQGQFLALEESLYRACQLQSQHHLERLAQRVAVSPCAELILPDEAQSQVDELIAYLKQYEQVFDSWGFNKKLTRGRGMAALFTGSPGTGKTLAAEVVAAQLKLELYKINLSAVVNKYIGETEKHLETIFDEAAQANVALFFDEADALFGKRSEVQSSHDRYANLETNYLLQKLESHEGVVILASNYKSNIDEAFIRRLQFCIDFPLPDEQERLRIWQSIWPNELPLSPDIELEKLAKQLELAGGHIRNISLAAAFKAAQENASAITWQHIRQAAYRELKKIGRIVQFDELLTP